MRLALPCALPALPALPASPALPPALPALPGRVSGPAGPVRFVYLFFVLLLNLIQKYLHLIRVKPLYALKSQLWPEAQVDYHWARCPAWKIQSCNLLCPMDVS